MSFSGPPGAQQYSDEEFVAIVDEAHRAGVKVAAHAHGDAGIQACIRAGVDCIEHGSLASDETTGMMMEHGTFLVATSYLSEGLDVSKAGPIRRRRRPCCSPRRGRCWTRPSRWASRSCGTDAPAIPHGDEAKELWAHGRPWHDPDAGHPGSTVMSAELIDVDDRGPLEPGLLADIIAVPGDPSEDITLTRGRPVRHEGRDHLQAALGLCPQAGRGRPSTAPAMTEVRVARGTQEAQRHGRGRGARRRPRAAAHRRGVRALVPPCPRGERCPRLPGAQDRR